MVIVQRVNKNTVTTVRKVIPALYATISPILCDIGETARDRRVRCRNERRLEKQIKGVLIKPYIIPNNKGYNTILTNK